MKRTIDSLLDQTGVQRTGQQALQKVVEDTYEELFKSNGPDAAWDAAWAKHKHLIWKKVTEQQRAIMDRDFSEAELLEALQEMPSSKSPGHDGITAEFFLAFWSDLKEMVLAAVVDAWEQGSPGPFFNKGLVCLCPKTGDP